MRTWRKVSSGRSKIAATLRPHGNEKRRKRGSVNDRATIIVVAVTEAHHLAVGQKSLKVERPERKPAKFARERFLFLDRQNFRIISEPFRQARGRGKQIGLTGGRGRPDAAGWSLHPPIDKRRPEAIQGARRQAACHSTPLVGPRPPIQAGVPVGAGELANAHGRGLKAVERGSVHLFRVDDDSELDQRLVSERGGRKATRQLRQNRRQNPGR